MTVGRDLDDAGLAARISEVVRGLGGNAAAFADVEQAGRALAEALRELPGPVLLVADDVWNQAQLAPFLAAGQAGRLLVTSRRPGALDGTGARLSRIADSANPHVRRHTVSFEAVQGWRRMCPTRRMVRSRPGQAGRSRHRSRRSLP
jgi:hypothetical protein